MLFRFHYHRPLDVAVHAHSQAEAEAAVEAELRVNSSRFRPGGWLLDAAYLVDDAAPVNPTDLVVHQGRVVRADTIDTRTLPMPWAKEPG